MTSRRGRRGRLAVALLAALGGTAAVAPVAAGRQADDPPRCFGAASRDREEPCANPRLRLMVEPSPQGVDDLPNGPCEVEGTVGGQKVCAVGVPAREAVTTAVLIGDSHTTHWRAGVDVMARARSWRVLQLAHQSCPLSGAKRAIPEPTASSCLAWRRAVLRWLRRHPEVRTVLVSQLSGGTGVVPTRGRDPFETAVAGYVAGWRALPRSVEHVVVIRDNPKRLDGAPECILAAVERRRRPDRACAVRRGDVLDPDPAAVAARRLDSRRVRLVDLTRFHCSRRRCFPVVGGVLVHQDQNHMTWAFSETLGPYLLRAVDRIVPREPAAP